MSNIKFAAKTDVGRKRTLNEDSFCAAEDIGLFMVADGMGGHAAGEIASQTTIEVVRMSLTEWLKKGPPNAEILVRAIQLANKAVFEMAANGDSMKGMGTTVAAILVSDGYFTAANVGDSRIYRIRKGKQSAIEQLSTDHSMVEMQRSAGLISADQARHSKYKNVITRAIGTAAAVEVDTRDEDVRKGDIILICSDGLTTLVEDSDMLDVIKCCGDNISKACEELVGMANFKGGDDNITVVLVKFA